MFDYNEIRVLTFWAIKKFNIKMPINITPEEFVHEVQTYMFLHCKINKPNSTVIIKNVMWTLFELNNWGRKYKKLGDDILYESLNDNFLIPEDDYMGKEMDDKHMVEVVMSTPNLTDRERKSLNCLMEDLETKDRNKKVGVNNSQRFAQIKNEAIIKAKEYLNRKVKV